MLMSKYKHHKPKGFLERMSYVSFQGYYRIKANENSGLTLEEVFSKCILNVLEWIETKTRKNHRTDEFSHFLSVSKELGYSNYYHKFLKQNDPFYFAESESYDIKFFSDLRDNEWSAVVVEPDNLKQTKKYMRRLFVTDIAFKMRDDYVYMAVRIVVKDVKKELSDEDTAAWRPAFVPAIYNDDSFVVYEGSISVDDYPISENLIVLNTKSSNDCERFYNNLIASSDRQMPIILCPYTNDDELRDRIEELAGRTAGMAYVVVEEHDKNYAKLVHNNDDKIVKGDFNYILPYNNEEKKYYHRAIGDDGANGISYARFIAKQYTVCRDGVTKKPAYQYGDVLFFQQLYAKYIKSVEDAADVELINNLQQEIGLLLDELQKKSQSLSEQEDIIKEIQGANDKLKTVIRKKEKDNNHLNNIIDQQNTKIEAIDNKIEDASDDTDEQINDEGYKRATNKYNDRLNSVRYSWNNELKTIKKKDVVKWIEEKYSDTIYIHDDAKRAFEKNADGNLDLEKFCEAFNYLDCYVRFRNGKMSPEVYDSVLDGTTFRVTPHGFTGDRKDYSAYYVDVHEGGCNEEGLLCDLHIKYLANNPRMFRIYFAYVPELEKVVVGSMPDHLSTGPSGRGRKTKA